MYYVVGRSQDSLVSRPDSLWPPAYGVEGRWPVAPDGAGRSLTSSATGKIKVEPLLSTVLRSDKAEE
jgi:hypothetical protein